MQPRSLALARIDARLRATPQSVELALDRARILADLGRWDEAQAAYLQVLGRAPDDVRALTDFGALLVRANTLDAARTVLERAVAIDSTAVLAHANLGHALFAQAEYAAARASYETALALDPDLRAAHQGLSYALTRLGDDAAALEHRRHGFGGHAVTTEAYRGTAPPIDVLLVVCAAGGTLYTETFLDPAIHRTTTLVADMLDGTEAVPPVDVAFNAVSDADRNGAVLRGVAPLLRQLGVRTINDPQRVLATARAELGTLLAGIDGVVAPRTVPVALADLNARGAACVEGAGLAFPVLVRAPGFHTGQHFVRVERADDLPAALAAFPGEHALLIEFVETRSADGRVRKYRMMAIGGALYPLHVAVARDWKVHYFTADMASDAGNRAEDDRFLAAPGAVLGDAALRTLARIAAAVGLDYMGIDFGIDAAGRVVVFEANATMIVLPPGKDAMWDYRRAPVQKIITAVRALIAGSQ